MSEENKHAKHGARYKARRHAAEILFEAEARDLDPVEVTRTREELSAGPEPVSAPVRPYTKQIVEGVAVNLDLIDFAIERELTDTDWTFDRLPGVDRAVLRVASWELLFNGDDVPNKTAVTQAVELVSELSTDDSPSYVNAVLDAMWKNPESPADALARAEAEAEAERLAREQEIAERRAEAERRAAENAAFAIEGLDDVDGEDIAVTSFDDDDDSFAADADDAVPSQVGGSASLYGGGFSEAPASEPESAPEEIGVVTSLPHTFEYAPSVEEEGETPTGGPETTEAQSELVGNNEPEVSTQGEELDVDKLEPQAPSTEDTTAAAEPNEGEGTD